jgi:hypothetical protein
MSISYTCECGKKFRAKIDYAGRKAVCSSCHREFQFPIASETDPVAAPPPIPEQLSQIQIDDEDDPVVPRSTTSRLDGAAGWSREKPIKTFGDELREVPKDWILIILTWLLWMSLIVSGAEIFYIIPMGDSRQQANEYIQELTNPDAKDRERIYIAKLTRALNPFGSAPTRFVVSLGFLAVLRAQRVYGIVAAAGQ